MFAEIMTLSHLSVFAGGCVFWHFIGGKVWSWIKSKF